MLNDIAILCKNLKSEHSLKETVIRMMLYVRISKYRVLVRNIYYCIVTHADVSLSNGIIRMNFNDTYRRFVDRVSLVLPYTFVSA